MPLVPHDRLAGGAAVSAGIPLKKWLGHARLTTTAIDADAVDAEEKDIAREDVGVSPTISGSVPNCRLHDVTP